jgi:hypothetical protein
VYEKMSGFAQKRSFCKRRGENKGAKRLVLQKQLEAAIARHARVLQIQSINT